MFTEPGGSTLYRTTGPALLRVLLFPEEVFERLTFRNPFILSLDWYFRLPVIVPEDGDRMTGTGGLLMLTISA